MRGGKYLYRSYGADKRRAGRRGGSFSVAAAVAVVCVFSVIAVNALSPSDLLIYMPCRPCYAVCMGVFDNGEAAEKFALLLKERGGAGYVLSDGGRFLTLAAAYGSEADAVKVSDRLKEEGENASVIDLSLKAENISFGGEARLAKLCAGAADMIYRAFLELTVIADKIDAAAYDGGDLEDIAAGAEGIAGALTGTAESMADKLRGLAEICSGLSGECTSSDVRAASFDVFLSLKTDFR